MSNKELSLEANILKDLLFKMFAANTAEVNLSSEVYTESIVIPIKAKRNIALFFYHNNRCRIRVMNVWCSEFEQGVDAVELFYGNTPLTSEGFIDVSFFEKLFKATLT